MELRLFFALWPDAETRATLGGEDRTLFSGAGGKRVAPEEFHLTVRYLGSVDAGLLPEIEDLGERAARITAPSVVQLDAVEWWREAKVLVRTASSTPHPLLHLHHALEVGLKTLGIGVEPHPLKLHLTQVRSVGPHPIGTGPSAPLAWPADQLALVETVASGGSRYRVRKQWPFLGAPVG